MRRHTILRDGDEGFTLLAVVGAMGVLMLFLMATLAFALQSMAPARADQDGKAALAAAQAGIDEFVSRLNVNDTYWTNNGNDASNPAFGTGAPVPGTDGHAAGFTYRLLTNATEIAQDGVIRLRATGTSRGESRTLTAELKPLGFLRFLYYTDVEVTDPALYRDDVRAAVNGSTGGSGRRFYADPAQVDALCSRHYYAGRATYVEYTSGPTADGVAERPYYDYDTTTKVKTKKTAPATVQFPCKEIQFTGGDLINGPLHSNDALQIQGSPWFASAKTETSWADGATPAPAPGQRWWGGGTPKTEHDGKPGHLPAYAPPIGLPPTNTELVRYADPDTGPGCLYRGATRIRFVDDKMLVLSPGTTDAPPRCYDTSSETARGTEQEKAIPPVVYVDSVATCGPVGVGYPREGEDLTKGETTDYDCHKGNAYVQGTVSGQLTVGASNDIVVTGNLTYKDDLAGADVVGLIADNNVWVYHPVRSDGSNLLGDADTVRTIDAAILSVRHSFVVQNWDRGAALSTGDESTKLRVRGAIAQKFRGPVGTGNGSNASTGYLKNYVYDRRLLNLPPPFFLKSPSSPWEVTRVSDG